MQRQIEGPTFGDTAAYICRQPFEFGHILKSGGVMTSHVKDLKATILKLERLKTMLLDMYPEASTEQIDEDIAAYEEEIAEHSGGK